MNRLLKHLPIILLAFLMISCGSSGSTADSTGNGSITFDLTWENTAKSATSSARFLATNASGGDVCVDYGIDTVAVDVYDSSNSLLNSGSWPCSAHQWSLTVPVGSNYTIVVTAIVDGQTSWRGETTGVNVNAGATTDVGTIAMD